MNKQHGSAIDLSMVGANGAIDLSMVGANSAKNTLFKPMGFRGPNYYFYVRKLNQVIAVKSGQFKQRWLLRIADLSWWQSQYKTEDKRFVSGVRWSHVEADLIEKCHEVGEFNGIATVKKSGLPQEKRAFDGRNLK